MLCNRRVHVIVICFYQHGLNEELGRHRGREGKVECSICGAECESVVHCGSVQHIAHVQKALGQISRS